MAEGVGLEPTSPKAPVFKTGGLPIILTLRGRGKIHRSCLNSTRCRPGFPWEHVTCEIRETRQWDCLSRPVYNHPL